MGAHINRTRQIGSAKWITDFHPEVTRVFNRELTHLEIMFRGSGLGLDIIVLPLFRADPVTLAFKRKLPARHKTGNAAERHSKSSSLLSALFSPSGLFQRKFTGL